MLGRLPRYDTRTNITGEFQLSLDYGKIIKLVIFLDRNQINSRILQLQVKESINIKERKRWKVVQWIADPYIIRVGAKQRKRGGRKFREGQAPPDKNNDATASCVSSGERMLEGVCNQHGQIAQQKIQGSENRKMS